MTTLLAIAIGLAIGLPLGRLVAAVLDRLASNGEERTVDRHLPFEDQR